MGKRKLLMFLLINLSVLLSSCTDEEYNLKWLKEENEGKIENHLGSEFIVEDIKDYVVVTSNKVSQEYGYIFLNRRKFDKLYLNKKNVDFNRKSYDVKVIIFEGAILEHGDKDAIVNFVSEF